MRLLSQQLLLSERPQRRPSAPVLLTLIRAGTRISRVMVMGTGPGQEFPTTILGGTQIRPGKVLEIEALRTAIVARMQTLPVEGLTGEFLTTTPAATLTGLGAAK